MSKDKEHKCIFALGVSPDGTKPTIILGVPKAAWDYMKDGKTHTFDFTQAGLPIQVIMFGAETQEEILELINQASKLPQFEQDLEKDFGIKEPTKN